MQFLFIVPPYHPWTHPHPYIHNFECPLCSIFINKIFISMWIINLAGTRSLKENWLFLSWYSSLASCSSDELHLCLLPTSMLGVCLAWAQVSCVWTLPPLTISPSDFLLVLLTQWSWTLGRRVGRSHSIQSWAFSSISLSTCLLVVGLWRDCHLLHEQISVTRPEIHTHLSSISLVLGLFLRITILGSPLYSMTCPTAGSWSKWLCNARTTL